MIKVVFLGTNGWYDTETGNTVCVLIETDECFIVLDAGNGIYKLDKYIKDKKPIYLFLSHFHLDHIMGFHVLGKFNFKQGINIYGQKGTKDLLANIMRKHFTIPFENLTFSAKVYDLPEGLQIFPFGIEYRELLHSTKCLGYRFNISGKIIAYCSDTGVCPNVIELAKKADLLIAECSFASGQKHQECPHMNPEDVATVAKTAGARKLALTHFDASIYTDLKKRKQAQAAARKIFKNTFAAFDGVCVKV